MREIEQRGLLERLPLDEVLPEDHPEPSGLSGYRETPARVERGQRLRTLWPPEALRDRC